jgi:tetratricopeptide (TPR) repeat protein
MKLKLIFIQLVCLWCIAVENNAQAPPQSNVEKVRSVNTLIQRYLLPYKQALNNAMDRNDYAAALINLNQIIRYEPNNGQALYLRARGFENIGLYERAIFDFDNAQRVGYTDPQLFYFLARLEIKAGLGEESFLSFNEFFKSQPSQFTKKELRYESGVAAKMAKEYKACVEDLTFVINEGRDEADAYFNRGICFSELNILKEAKLDFKEAVRLKPQLKDHWYYITYDRIYKNNCKQTEQQFLTIINKEMDKKEYFDAFIDAQLGLKCYPESKALMNKQLEAMLTQFELYYDEIIVFYQDYVKKHGADQVMQQKMDRLLATRKQISVSDQPYDRNYPNDTEMPQRYRKVADYLKLSEENLKQKKDYAQVIDYCNNALRIEPKNADAFLMRAKAFLQMDKKLDSSIAWRDANSAIFYKPDLAGAYYIRGMIAMQDNNNELAKADLLKAIELKKDHYESKILLVKLYDKLGDKAQADQIHQSLMKEVPQLDDLKLLANRNTPLN